MDKCDSRWTCVGTDCSGGRVPHRVLDTSRSCGVGRCESFDLVEVGTREMGSVEWLTEVGLSRVEVEGGKSGIAIQKGSIEKQYFCGNMFRNEKGHSRGGNFWYSRAQESVQLKGRKIAVFRLCCSSSAHGNRKMVVQNFPGWHNRFFQLYFYFSESVLSWWCQISTNNSFTCLLFPCLV